MLASPTVAAETDAPRYPISQLKLGGRDWIAVYLDGDGAISCFFEQRETSGAAPLRSIPLSTDDARLIIAMHGKV